MNKRQKKKAFKKKYGVNPPKNISASRIEQAAKCLITIWERIKNVFFKYK